MLIIQQTHNISASILNFQAKIYYLFARILNKPLINLKLPNTIPNMNPSSAQYAHHNLGNAPEVIRINNREYRNVPLPTSVSNMMPMPADYTPTPSQIPTEYTPSQISSEHTPRQIPTYFENLAAAMFSMDINSTNQRPIVETSSIPKTPLALLYEVCTKNGIVPDIQVNPEVALPTPTYACQIKLTQDGQLYEGSGRARSVQQSKHEAARDLLTHMDSRTERLLVGTPRPELISQVDAGHSSGGRGPLDDNLPEGNPVGELAELCAKTKLPTPVYKDELESGPSHDKFFQVSCAVNVDPQYYEVGKAKTKKIAKRIAASMVLIKVQESMKTAFGKQICKEDSGEIDVVKLGKMIQAHMSLQNSAASSVPEIPEKTSTTTTFSPSLATLSKIFQNMSGANLDKLLKSTMSELQKFDLQKILQAVAAEQKWTIEFLDYPPNPEDKKFHCLLSCQPPETIPRFILKGTGDSAALARKAATIDFLETVRLICRKPTD